MLTYRESGSQHHSFNILCTAVVWASHSWCYEEINARFKGGYSYVAEKIVHTAVMLMLSILINLLCLFSVSLVVIKMNIFHEHHNIVYWYCLRVWYNKYHHHCSPYKSLNFPQSLQSSSLFQTIYIQGDTLDKKRYAKHFSSFSFLFFLPIFCFTDIFSI